ncbi:MAG: hypothetical protein HQL31_10935, partial [Planctomycetes bacterium]|nr:hypothetical protein [Planctomycetota bacterium]
MSPRIYLAIDNCFASKRWCEVDEWMGVVKDLGVKFVEASADNEIDPLYSTREHMKAWTAEVLRSSVRTGIEVVNCYSGHGTYSTLGLAHHDEGVRRHLRDNWMAVMMRTAGSIGAGLGFFAHAFSERVLRQRRSFEEAYSQLIGVLQELRVVAEEENCRTFAIEQMYTPHQVPWTLTGSADFLRKVNSSRKGRPLYLTLDSGHQSGQRNYTVPSDEQLEGMIRALGRGERTGVYLGPRECYQRFEDQVSRGCSFADLRQSVDELVKECPHLFAAEEDGDTYLWLERFGCYSPIVHLQQTDGRVSAHRNFTPEWNKRGIIEAPRVLDSLRASYARSVPEGFPPKVDTIYLTLEPFLSTAC